MIVELRLLISDFLPASKTINHQSSINPLRRTPLLDLPRLPRPGHHRHFPKPLAGLAPGTLIMARDNLLQPAQQQRKTLPLAQPHIGGSLKIFLPGIQPARVFAFGSHEFF
jgi:hypothetical protein